ncbi:MAG: nucleotidyltransferase domain-containing protein [Oscillospiraceae bacterium]|nr:nucleotidyltransferase domain-containing protein [Oscillospiraceae bacterium]
MDGVFTVDEIRTRLKPVFDEYGVKRAVLFGSYANGTAGKKSDVDILVDSGLKGLRFFGLLEMVVTALGKDADLIDVTHINQNSPIEKEINETGVLLY